MNSRVIAAPAHARLVFQPNQSSIMLGTARNTRAENFYTLQGWNKIGSYPNGESKFELSLKDWTRRHK